MQYLALLNGKEIAIENADEINNSWSVDFPSPNPNFTFTNSISIPNTNDAQNGYDIFNQFIAQYGAYNSIPFSFTDLHTGDILFNGVALPYGENTSIDLQKFTVYLQIIETQLNDLLASQNIATITNKEIKYYITHCVLQDKTRTELQTIIALLGIVAMILELMEAAKQFGDFVSVNPLTPEKTILAGVLLAIQYTIAIISIVNFINSLRPITRTYNAVKVIDILTVACSKLGLGFKSSILESSTWNMSMYIAETDYEGDKKNAPINNPLPKKNLLDFFADLSLMFNAKVKLFNNVLYFERVDYYQTYVNPINNLSSGFVLNNLQNNGLQSYNFNELYNGLKISFTKDSTDLNTTQRTLASNPQPNSLFVSYKIKDNLIRDKKNQALKETNEIQIPFARAMRKNETTFIEDAYREIANIFSEVIGIISFGMIDLGKVENSLGYMLISDYTIGIDKIFIGTNDGKISANNLGLCNAKYLYDNFHKISTVVGNNQWIKVSNVSLSTEQSRFISTLKQWNIGLGVNLQPIVITKFDEDLERQTYTLEYRFRQTFIPLSALEITEITE